MKKIIAAFFILFIIASSSCKKNNDVKPAIAGQQLQVVQMWERDTIVYVVPIPNPTFLKVEEDKSWTLNVNGNIGKGTLTWEPINAEAARVKFTVTNWIIPASDALQNKLRRIVESVNQCEFGPSFNPGVHFTINGDGTNNSYFYTRE